MAARSIGSLTISFGLVSIPVRLYVATHSERLSFNMLHAACGSRVKQQLYCPTCERVLARDEIVKGYEFTKDRYVTFTDAELKGLEAEGNRSVDIDEFVPLAEVDPIYYESAHYLGPDKGAEKAYHLLAQAMRDTERGALAHYTSHGKENLALIRPFGKGLVLHAMHYVEEVRPFDEVDTGGAPKVRPAESELARKLIAELSVDEFKPEQHRDAYRERVQAAVDKKVAGEEVTVTEPRAARAEVIDLMQALKESLGKRGRGAAKAPAAAGRTAGKRRPAAAAERREPARAQRRAQKK